MADPQPPLLTVLGRNVDVLAFQRGLSPSKLAAQLGISLNALSRVRFARCRYIDPELLLSLTEVFSCSFNDLLTPQPGIDYKLPQRP